MEQLDAFGCLLVGEPARVHLTALGVTRARREVEQTRRAPHIKKFGQFRTEVTSARSQPLTGFEIPIASITRSEPEGTLHRTHAPRATVHHTFARVLGPNKYLIQFAPHDSTTDSREDMLASIEGLLREETDGETVDREMRFLRDQDPQEPLEVNGDHLEYAGASDE